MFRTGMTIQTITEKMKRFTWIKFSKRIDFVNGETNLIYQNGNDTICFYFDSNKHLVDVY